MSRCLSVVIPAFNEERFIGPLLDRVMAVDLTPLGFDKEVIVIDDCSSDRTAAIVEGMAGVRLMRMERNGGKGRAVRAGIATATGDLLIIQDADLEYDPEDYLPMLQRLLGGGADAVYGSRYVGRGRYDQQSLAAYLGGTDPKNPLASALYGDSSSLPPIRVHVGDDEVLLDDSRRYVERAVAAGVDARLDVWMGMPHGFVAYVREFDAARQALSAIGAFLTGRFS